jgi:ribosomal protein S18 acetylase RimI-like enzyme
MSAIHDRDVEYAWRGEFDSRELNALHCEAFGHAELDDDWRAQAERHSLGWVCARRGDELIGWVNVAWDGGVHAFILDTIVAERVRHRGIGSRLVAEAVEEARRAGCEWLHVDFDDDLAPFYLEGCGFRPTPAGLIRLR